MNMLVCHHCGEVIKPIKKMFNTLVCPKCNKIISGRFYIGKG